MNKQLLVILVSSICCVQSISAQYYYKEILSNKQLIADRNTFKSLNTRKIEIHSIEANGEPSEGFFCEKKINKSFTEIETRSNSSISGKSTLTTYFNEKGLPNKTTNVSDDMTAVSTYQYDRDNNLIDLISYSYSTEEIDTALVFSSSTDTTTLFEEHKYSYNVNGQPVQMLRIKNKKDTTVVNFIIDEKGNVSDEIETNPGGRHYYFYYSENNRLTDIVRYNVIRKKMLPDLMFEYNTDGQLLQMISVEEEIKNVYSNEDNYFIWKYFYGDDGLRIIEKCYSKDKELLGSFEYEYK